MKKYRMQSKSDRKAEILIYEDIGGAFVGGLSAKKFAADLAAMGRLDEINVRFNCNGGDTLEGFAIISCLQRHPAKITVDIDGVAAGIGAALAVGVADTGNRRMAENAFMMIQSPYQVVSGSAGELRKSASNLDKLRDRLLDVYAKGSKAGREQIAKWMQAETWLTAREALAAGLVDEISSEMRMAAFAGFDLARYRNVPSALVNRVRVAQSKYSRPETSKAHTQCQDAEASTTVQFDPAQDREQSFPAAGNGYFPKEVMTMKEYYERLPFGKEKRLNLGFGDICPACDTKRGSLHVPGCVAESCPKCHRSIVGCSCQCLEPEEGAKIIQGIERTFASIDDIALASGSIKDMDKLSYSDQAAINVYMDVLGLKPCSIGADGEPQYDLNSVADTLGMDAAKKQDDMRAC